VRQSWGELVTYQYFTGDPPNYRRAAVYAVLAGLTLGVSELVTSPMEFVQGDRHVVSVRFDRRGNLLDSKTQTFNAPLEAPEKILGLEETLAAEPSPAQFIRLPVPTERARLSPAKKL
jgi:hypothetical protein